MLKKYSFYNLKRSPVKTVLYVILLIVITLFLCAGIELWSESLNLIKKLDDSYSIIGIIEYVGGNYPDTSTILESTNQTLDGIDAIKIISNPDVLNWDYADIGKGSIDGLFVAPKGSSYYNSGVIVVSGCFPSSTLGIYGCRITETIYATKDYSGGFAYVNCNLVEQTLEKNRTYVLHGQFYDGANGYPHFMVRDISIDGIFVDGIAANSFAPYADVTESYSANRSIPDVFEAIGEAYDRINSCLSVCATSDVANLENFHQKVDTLNQGRFFTSAEYATNEKVCILSTAILNNMELKIGDTVSLSVYFKEKDISLEQGYLHFDNTQRENYTIVGAFNASKDTEFCIFIPTSIRKATSSQAYTLGQATIKNGRADAFVDALTPLLPHDTIVTVYDQGYSTIFAALDSLRQLGVVLTIVSIIVGIVVLGLFAFLFVGKQRETLSIMSSLGTGRKGIYGYLAFGANIMAVPSALFSCTVFYLLFTYLFKALFSLAQKNYSYDLRFSSAKQGIQNEYILEIAPNLAVIALICIGALLFANLMCYLMVNILLKNPQSVHKHTKKISKLRERKTLHLRGGSFKYAILSMSRGGLRTLVVVVLSCVIVIFMSVLSMISASYDTQLKTAYETADISATFTDFNGRGVGNLVLDTYTIKAVNDSGFAEDMCFSWKDHYLYDGCAVKADGSENTLSITVPDPSSYAYPTMIDLIGRQPNLVFTNSIKNSPEFYYSKSLTMQFLSGYSEDDLSSKKNVGLVPYSLAEAKDIDLGDTISVYMSKNNVIYNRQIKVIGYYVKAAYEKTIYCSLPSVIDIESVLNGQTNLSLHSCTFKIDNASNLSAFKDDMANYKLSEVKNANVVRCFLLIQDKEFLDTISGINQNIRYLRAMYIVLLILVVFLGFLVSYLLTNARKNELAIMRSMGTSKLRTFLSFFIEQALLCLCGAILGLAIVLTYYIPDGKGILSIALFIAVYLLGSSISVAIMNKISVLNILSQKE